MKRTVTILALDACAMAFQMCRTSAGRPLRIHYTTTPPRMFIFSEAENPSQLRQPRRRKIARDDADTAAAQASRNA